MAEVLNNTNIIKIFHAANEDIKLLAYICNIKPNSIYNIFDTQIAANFIKLNELKYNISYADLINKLLNITLKKEQTVTNWLIRPLNNEQITYAALDVFYLYKAYLILIEQINNNKLININWIYEESLINLTDPYFVDKDDYLKIVRNQNLSSIQIKTLHNLYNLREQIAQAKDKPRNWIFSKDDLLKIVQNMPTRVNHLYNLKIKTTYADKIINTIKNGLENYDADNKVILKNYDRLSVEQSYKLKELKNKIKIIAAQYQIPHQLITPKKELSIFIKTNKIPNTLGGYKLELLQDLLLTEISTNKIK